MHNRDADNEQKGLPLCREKNLYSNSANGKNPFKNSVSYAASRQNIHPVGVYR